MGAGLLVGTALSVIIPEGMQTLNMAYSIKEHASHHGGEGTEESGHAHQHEEKLQLVSVMGAGLLVGTALSVIIPEGMQTLNMAYSIKEHASHHGGEDTEESGHAHQHEENPVPHIIGVSLVLGFIFMLIVDQVANAMSASRDVEVGKGRGVVSWTATLGLVVHAAADGVALGAAATTNQTDVEVIVFLAIMLHKAPASFGLVTYL